MGGVKSHNDKDDSTNQKGQGHEFIHKSGSSAPGDEVDQHHDQRHDQQDMDYPTHRVTGYQAEQPQDDQDYRDCV
jgi:hypothetical protein